MTKLNEVYKCEICGNIIEVVHTGAPALVCCDQPMKAITENSVDAAKEKHVPAFEKSAQGLKIAVGTVTHPMEEKHYIEWIEVIAGDKVYKRYLKPGQKPEAVFPITEGDFIVREYCNLHGLWINKARPKG